MLKMASTGCFKRDKEDSEFANNLIIDLQIGAAHIKEIKHYLSKSLYTFIQPFTSINNNNSSIGQPSNILIKQS